MVMDLSIADTLIFGNGLNNLSKENLSHHIFLLISAYLTYGNRVLFCEDAISKRTHKTTMDSIKALNISEYATSPHKNRATTLTLAKLCASYPEYIVILRQYNDPLYGPAVFSRVPKSEAKLAEHIPRIIFHPFVATLYPYFDSDPKKQLLIKQYALEFWRMVYRTYSKRCISRILSPKETVEMQVRNSRYKKEYIGPVTMTFNENLFIKMTLIKDSLRLANDKADGCFDFSPYQIGPKLQKIIDSGEVFIPVPYKNISNILRRGDDYASRKLDYKVNLMKQCN
ncbi:uncharacterized protein SAPINGB_P002273 [Magnusiomyces paraingens]|uniref:Uncharacterized protein n=1 Tax=Magnusiomyces paraingens TaxID=2606893 RepID=A0A5E8BFB8_9ASCO|nr:uncharacterized protein SAPINGB_P002273 [Saprochaete ingens]VVT49445.1 unnamed protein product [Saprochaete ingens]